MDEQSAKPWVWIALTLGLAAALFAASQWSQSMRPVAPPPVDYSLASSAAEPRYRLPANGVLTSRDLTNIAKLVRDKGFPDTGLEGRAFAVELPVGYDQSGQLTEHLYGANFSYHGRERVLRLAVNLVGTQDGRYYVPLQSEQIGLPGQSQEDRSAGRNYVDWDIGIGRDDRTPAGVFSPEVYGIRARFLRYLPLVRDVKSIPFDQIDGKLRLRLEGMLDRSTTQHVIDCEVFERIAPEGEKLGGVRSTCHINARFKRVAILGPDAQVLAEWP